MFQDSQCNFLHKKQVTIKGFLSYKGIKGHFDIKGHTLFTGVCLKSFDFRLVPAWSYSENKVKFVFGIIRLLIEVYVCVFWTGDGIWWLFEPVAPSQKSVNGQVNFHYCSPPQNDLNPEDWYVCSLTSPLCGPRGRWNAGSAVSSACSAASSSAFSSRLSPAALGCRLEEGRGGTGLPQGDALHLPPCERAHGGRAREEGTPRGPMMERHVWMRISWRTHVTEETFSLTFSVKTHLWKDKLLFIGYGQLPCVSLSPPDQFPFLKCFDHFF